MTEQLPEDMDAECIRLVEAMNMVPGIRTTESCCGHGEDSYRIWFEADNMECLPRLLYYFDGCHSGFYDWRVTIETDCGMSYPTLCAIGPVGENAYRESEYITNLLWDEIEKDDSEP